MLLYFPLHFLIIFHNALNIGFSILFIVMNLFFDFVGQLSFLEFGIFNTVCIQWLDHKVIKFLLEIICLFNFGFNIEIYCYLILVCGILYTFGLRFESPQGIIRLIVLFQVKALDLQNQEVNWQGLTFIYWL